MERSRIELDFAFHVHNLLNFRPFSATKTLLGSPLYEG